MAEAAQKILEQMTKEFEDMHASGLFTDEELSKMKQIRKDHEHKMCSRQKQLEDVENGIKQLKKIVKIVRAKEGTAKTGFLSKLLRKIKLLYEIGINHFPFQSHFFASCLVFYKTVNLVSFGTQTVAKITQKYPNDISVWQTAAAWYAHECNDKEAARKMLWKGLASNSDNIDLYKQLIRLELPDIESFQDESNTDENNLAEVKLTEIVNHTFNHINNCAFYVNLLDILKPYPYTSLPQTICRFLLEKYGDKEIVWHVMAQRELQAISTDQTDEDSIKHLKACYAKYREGLATISPANKPQLWALYINCLVENSLEMEGVRGFIETQLKRTLAEADKESVLTEMNYLVWLRLMEPNEGLSIVERATKVFPESIDLWQMRLQFEITLAEKHCSVLSVSAMERIKVIFKEGITSLKLNSLPMWNTMLKYCILSGADALTIEQIFWDGVAQPEEIANEMKPQFIEWLAVTCTIHTVREIYNELANEKPYCKELHMAMGCLESTQLEPHYVHWAHVLELACEQFQHSDVDVWIQHIDFYISENMNRSLNVREKIDQLYKDALKNLHPKLIPKFTEQFEKMRASIERLS